MTNTRKLIYSAICLAIWLLLPQVFHMFSVANAGSVFCPMHLPVLLCGFLCGWIWGGAVGILVPLLSSLITGMPPAPMNISMMLELCAYGALAGVFYKVTKKKVFLTLILAMLGGRIVLGIANTVIFGLSGTAYGFTTFLTSAFVTALPGIVIQLVLIPVILFALKKAKLAD